MKKRTWMAIVIAVIALAAFIVWRLSLGPNKGIDVIKIGAVLPLTGPASAIGNWQKKGIDLAVGEINAEGGVRGKQIRILYEDSKLDPKEAVTAIQKLIAAEKIPVVFVCGSGVANAVLPITDQNEINLLMIAVSLPNIADKSAWAFRFNVGSNDEAIVMARFLEQKLKIKNVAVFYINDEFGKGASEVFEKEFGNGNGKIVFSESYEVNASDFRSTIAKAQAKNPEAIYVIGYSRPAAIAMKQIREMALKCYILANMALTVPNMREVAAEAAEGAYYTTCLYDPSSSEENVVKFIKNYQAAYQETPPFFSAFAYDAAKCLELAIRQSGDTAQAINQGLLGISGYQGVMGNTDIMQNGDVIYPVRVVTLKRGKLLEEFK
jgi:branched-chain amino acid transport system substrate-binding protein